MAVLTSETKFAPLLAALCFFLRAFLAALPAGAEWKCSPREPGCKTVHIVHDSWHAGIVLRSEDIPRQNIPELGDIPAAEFVEFSWGDKDYFPDPNAGVLAALRAAFWSGGSVLHLVGFSRDLKAAYPGASITELNLAKGSFDRLVNFIAATFFRPAAQDRSPPSAGLYAYSRFYPSTHKFSLLKTCNTWVAEALEAAGLPVAPGQVLTSGHLASQIAGLGRALQESTSGGPSCVRPPRFASLQTAVVFQNPRAFHNPATGMNIARLPLLRHMGMNPEFLRENRRSGEAGVTSPCGRAAICHAAGRFAREGLPLARGLSLFCGVPVQPEFRS
jgi:uncharacterized protein (TIGR02117 family)